MPVTESTFLQLALEDDDGLWELHCGQLRRKADGGMTAHHGDLMFRPGVTLQQQLRRNEYRVRVNHGYPRRSETRYYIPAVLVIPTEMERAQRAALLHVETSTDPLPFVIEVSSPSTGSVDVSEKLPEYERRGDLEILLLHPYERWLEAAVRHRDGSYAHRRYAGGAVRPAYLPNVAIDLDALFAEQD